MLYGWMLFHYIFMKVFILYFYYVYRLYFLDLIYFLNVFENVDESI